MSKPHLTTRRGFIAAAGFGGVSLYGLWAAYGAAPTPLALVGLGTIHDAAAGRGHGHGSPVAAPGGHAGHGAAADGSVADAFRRAASEFVERYRMPDGSVYPRHAVMGAPHSVGDQGSVDQGSVDQGSVDHGSVDHGSVDRVSLDHHGSINHGPGAHGVDGAAPAPAPVPVAADGSQPHDAHDEDEAIDVYLLAEKWFYEPAVLRLDAGASYRFRMMATDVSHGASIQFGRGGRMIRLRPNTLVQLAATFEEPGTYLVYCTVYCGVMHDYMKARIEVV
jgi:cytochrome c oxidase subunit II